MWIGQSRQDSGLDFHAQVLKTSTVWIGGSLEGGGDHVWVGGLRVRRRRRAPHSRGPPSTFSFPPSTFSGPPSTSSEPDTKAPFPADIKAPFPAVLYVPYSLSTHSRGLTTTPPSKWPSVPTVPENGRKGNNFTGFEDFYPKARARIWPCLSYTRPESGLTGVPRS